MWFLHEWLGFCGAFFKYPPKWFAYSADMAGATRNCCRLGPSSVYTIQSQSPCHFMLNHVPYGACVFSCNLPPALFFGRIACATTVTRHWSFKCTARYFWLMGEGPSACISCDLLLTVEHVLLFCLFCFDWQQRERHFPARTMRMHVVQRCALGCILDRLKSINLLGEIVVFVCCILNVHFIFTRIFYLCFLINSVLVCNM